MFIKFRAQVLFKKLVILQNGTLEFLRGFFFSVTIYFAQLTKRALSSFH